MSMIEDFNLPIAVKSYELPAALVMLREQKKIIHVRAKGGPRGCTTGRGKVLGGVAAARGGGQHGPVKPIRTVGGGPLRESPCGTQRRALGMRRFGPGEMWWLRIHLDVEVASARARSDSCNSIRKQEEDEM